MFSFSLESTTSEVYKLRKVDGEKQKRLNSFKMKLEDSDQGVNKVISQKDERIQSLEEKYACVLFLQTLETRTFHAKIRC